MRKTETYNVVAGNLPELRFRIAGLNKKAVKLGMAPIELTEGKAFTKKMDASSEHVEMERTVVIVPVTLTGETPVLNGWEFVALLQHEDGGTLVKSVPGIEDGALKAFRDRPTGCDHCQVNRRRNDTFVVRHKNGELKQVGRNCLRDFLGHANPHAFAQMAELLMLASSACITGEDEEGFGGGFGGGSGGSAFSMIRFLSVTIAAIRERGWLSRTKARDTGREGQATADLVCSVLTRKQGKPFVTTMDDDKVEAERLFKLVEEHFENADHDKLGDYEHNLRVIVASNYVPFRGAGLAASIVTYARRLESDAVETKLNAGRKHVGTLGERVMMELTVAAIGYSENDYGTVSYVNFRDAEGNKLVWKASGHKKFKIGEKFEVVGSIEKHAVDRRDGKTPETWLKRCKVEELGYAVRAAEEKKVAAKAKREAAKAAKKAAKDAGGEPASAPTVEVAA